MGTSSGRLLERGQVRCRQNLPGQGARELLNARLFHTDEAGGFPSYPGAMAGDSDSDEVVLNHMALAQKPSLGVGDRVALSVDGRPSDLEDRRVRGGHRLARDRLCPVRGLCRTDPYGRNDRYYPGLSSRSGDGRGHAEEAREVEDVLEKAGASV